MTTSESERNLFLRFAWRYASRNVWRQKRRTLLTIGTVALSVAVSVIALRYSKALLSIWQSGSIDHGNGHAQIHRYGFLERPDVISMDHLMSNGDPAEKILKDDPHVTAFTTRINFEGMVSAGEKSVYFLGRGVDPALELQVAPAVFDSSADDGKFLSADQPNGVVIGRGLAEILGVKVGDEISLMTSTMSGAVNGIDAVIVGITTPPIPALSKRLLYTNLQRARDSIGLKAAYTEIAIRLDARTPAETWVNSHADALRREGYDLRGWWQLDPVIRKFERIWDSIVGVITGLLFLSAAISVLNIVYMMVAERTVEIGTLMAIGASARDVRNLFTLEAAIIGLLGGAAGSCVANVVLAAMYFFGVKFESPFGRGALWIHPTPSLTASVGVTLLSIGICALAAIPPARKAAKVEPIVAFRGQLT